MEDQGMSVDAGWLADPGGAHELRYWDGSAWTDHVSDQGVAGVDSPAGPLSPPPGADVPAPAEATPGKGGWKDKLKAAATTAATQGKQLADQAKSAAGEQQAKRQEQLANDPNTIWFGASKSAATNATGVSKALYRITKDRVWIDTGLLGVRSEQVPLWAVRDVDVRQSVLQRGKDIGDVVLHLEDPTLGVDPGNLMNMGGYQASEPGMTSGTVTLDNIEEPYKVRDLLMPLISEARSKKMIERQSQYLHVNPGSVVAAGMAATPPPPAPAPAASGPPVDVADQLRKLAALREEGILSDEEFAVQKARLLSG
jgi:hypothetical protein